MKKILSLLSIQQPEDLLGKKIKVEFFDENVGYCRFIFFAVTSFELTESELAFPPIITHQGGGEQIQISFFKPENENSSIEFHILMFDINDPERNELGYFYHPINEEDEEKQSWNHILSQGKVTIL